MKKGLSTILTIAITLMISFTIECVAGNGTYHSVSLRKQYKEHNQELDPEGVRMPPRNIICLISPTEFQSDIDPNDITSYEIWDESSNTCKASFLEDAAFCEYLFNIPDNYQIRIYTTNFVFIGYISTL